jgi:hypothetical protein
MSSTAGHTLAGIDAIEAANGADPVSYLATCSCNVGFWHETAYQAWAAWEKHVDRVAHTPRVATDPDGSEHTEADPVQYGREEDRRLTQQIGAWVPVADNGVAT